MSTRRAIVKGRDVTVERVTAYLPGNYECVSEVREGDVRTVIIEGQDSCGWTLDDYVIPRLASGCMFATEQAQP